MALRAVWQIVTKYTNNATIISGMACSPAFYFILLLSRSEHVVCAEAAALPIQLAELTEAGSRRHLTGNTLQEEQRQATGCNGNCCEQSCMHKWQHMHQVAARRLGPHSLLFICF